GGDDGGAVRESVEERGGELLVVAEHLGPLAESEVGGDQCGSPFVALGQQVEQQLAAGAVEGHEAELIEDEQVSAVDPAGESTDLGLVLGFDEQTYEVS